MLIAHGAKIEQRDLQGSTPLFLAVERNRSKMVALLLESGAKPDVPGRSGVSPLAAAAFNGSDAIVDLLLREGAGVNAEDVTGKTAIAYAAARGFSGIVEQLLGAGVDINRRYGNDLTVLIWAAGYANDVTEAEGLETVDLLIARGARLDDADNRGRTALMTAGEMGHADVTARLLEAGADPTLRDKDGKTALDLAADDSVRAALVRP
jgi:ankyrin repeat protein